MMSKGLAGLGAIVLISIGCVHDQIVSTTYPDGKLRSMYTLRNGQMNGLYQGWYESGLPEFFMTLSNGVYQGHWAAFRNDGAKSSEGNYENGERDGWFFMWHSNGVLREVVFYKNGKMAGDTLNITARGRMNYYLKHNTTGGVDACITSPQSTDEMTR